MGKASSTILGDALAGLVVVAITILTMTFFYVLVNR
jgi:hypothetical protein